MYKHLIFSAIILCTAQTISASEFEKTIAPGQWNVEIKSKSKMTPISGDVSQRELPVDTRVVCVPSSKTEIRPDYFLAVFAPQLSQCSIDDIKVDANTLVLIREWMTATGTCEMPNGVISKLKLRYRPGDSDVYGQKGKANAAGQLESLGANLWLDISVPGVGELRNSMAIKGKLESSGPCQK